MGYSDATKLIEALEHEAVKKIFEMWGYKSQLEDLRETVTVVQRVLLDADSKWDHLSNGQQDYIRKLNDVVCDAENVFDEFRTLAELNKLGKLMIGGEFFDKVLHFFSSDKNRFGQVNRMSGQVKDIKKRLDASVGDYENFGFMVDNKPFIKRREETCSYVYANRIIGRDEDLEKIIDMLLRCKPQENVSFLSIVGMAGVGKTALAQLVYNHEKIMQEFPNRKWVCIADQDGEHFDVKSILCKITDEELDGTSTTTLESVQRSFQDKFGGKKYFLVLDDVCNENCEKWLNLKKLLMLGHEGSKVVVTTPSEMTATIIGDGDDDTYRLKGLSDEDSWRLFKSVVFLTSTDMEDYNDRSVEIGKKIVKKCYCNPLAIKVVGSVLHDREISGWQFVIESGLIGLYEYESIISIFWPSYNHLQPLLKSCFKYYALFPKDFRMKKEMLISLWMAQGYIDPSHKNQSVEDAGEECISILENKCFFQDITRDEFGEIVSFKMHHLIHDLAQSVANEEMCIIDDFKTHVDRRSRHVSFVDVPWTGFNISDSNPDIQSLLHVGCRKSQGRKMPKLSLQFSGNFKFLRALDLSGLPFKKLPDLGKLPLLRFLNLSGNDEIEELPKAITNLVNLQTLYLQECHKLKALPKDLSKLTVLRLLNISSCSSLTCLPEVIGSLTSLRKLRGFRLGDEERDSDWKPLFDALWSLDRLDNLQGGLKIGIWWPSVKMVAEDATWKKSFHPLKNKVHLSAVAFDFKPEKIDRRYFEEFERPPPPVEELTRLMKEMEPPSSVKQIKLMGYLGLRMDWEAFPVNLVQLVIERCWELQFLPCLGNLPHLKVFKLLNMKKLEYIGQDSPLASSSSTPIPLLGSEGLSSYYPSLETLHLENLPLLKGWRSLASFDGSSNNNSDNATQWQLLPCFARLNSLFIWNCPELTCIPRCPAVEDLKMINFNRKLRVRKVIARGEDLVDVASSSTSCIGIDYPETSHSNGTFIQKGFKKVVLSDVVWLNSLPLLAFEQLEHLEVWCDKEVESLGEVEEVFRSCSSSLRVLIIHNCSKLRSVMSGGIEHLTALKKLEFRNGDSLELSEEEDEAEESRGAEIEDSIGIGLVSWSSNLRSLRTLTLQDLPKMVDLPNWIQFLPALENLCISYCWGLKSLPKWMTKLTSLKRLAISSCSASLEKRCKSDPPGEDWPNIEHITTNNIRFHNNVF